MAWHIVALEGCRSDVLAHYLKALAVFRLVATQKDSAARAFWKDGTFHLVSSLDLAALERFFLEEYAPSPMVAPWNGGSGFYPKDNREGRDAIESGEAERFAAFRTALSAAAALVGRAKESPKDDEKGALIAKARASWPAPLLPWLDAAISVTSETVRYPALLGTGGNDGRLDFTNNFMKRLVELLDPSSGAPRDGAGRLLHSALTGASVDGLGRKLAIGQFLPGSAGGANSTAGFAGESVVNPWEFVLGLEGTLGFQVAAVRRLQATELAQAAAPFAVRSTSAGYASSAPADESVRGEQWMPLWREPATWVAFERLLKEGRLLSGRQLAGNAIDAAMALGRSGTARGLEAFERFGFIERNGQANLAVPLGRWVVEPRPTVGVVDQVEGWVLAYRRAAEAKGAPKSAGLQARGLQAASLALLRQPTSARLESLLVRLGEAEDAIVRSPKWAKAARLAPLPPLAPEDLEASLDFDTPELELARALSSLSGVASPLRFNCLPLDETGRRFATGGESLRDSADVVWRSADLVGSLNRVVLRRLNDLGGGDAYPFRTRFCVRPESVAAFIEGALDDLRIARVARGLMSVRWKTAVTRNRGKPAALPPAFVACRLAWTGDAPWSEYRPDGSVPKLLMRGRGSTAVAAAERRLASLGMRLRFATSRHHVELSPAQARRLAAALVFPLSRRDLEWLLHTARLQSHEART